MRANANPELFNISNVRNVKRNITGSAVVETIPEPETVVFRQNRRTETEVFWSQVNKVSPSDVCVQIWYEANELVQ